LQSEKEKEDEPTLAAPEAGRLLGDTPHKVEGAGTAQTEEIL
jgi:hypothetical protein